jgi:hypothetical protein
MDKCSLYQLKTKFISSNELHPDRATRGECIKVPWCAHKHSPVTKKQTSVIGGANLLKCDGDLSKCQVDPAKMADTN